MANKINTTGDDPLAKLPPLGLGVGLLPAEVLPPVTVGLFVGLFGVTVDGGAVIVVWSGCVWSGCVDKGLYCPFKSLRASEKRY